MQANEFRTLCSRFATGVSVVTASGSDNQAVGMTVSSFTSVSLSPPLILVCLRTGSPSAQQLVRATHFGVNVLHEDQHWISRQFAGREHPDRFLGVAWRPGAYAVPVFDDILAHLTCRNEGSLTCGDHAVLFGRVIDGAYAQAGQPLIHWASDYHRLLRATQAAV